MPNVFGTLLNNLPPYILIELQPMFLLAFNMYIYWLSSNNSMDFAAQHKIIMKFLIFISCLGIYNKLKI